MGKSFCRQLLVKKRQTYSVASILALSNNPEVVSQKLSFNTMQCSGNSQKIAVIFANSQKFAIIHFVGEKEGQMGENFFFFMCLKIS